MPELPDWMSADEFRTTVEIPPHVANGEEGWLAEFRPLSLSANVNLQNETMEQRGILRHGPTLLDRQLVAITSPDNTIYDREDLGDIELMNPALGRFLADQAIDIARIGTANLGEGFTLRPQRGAAENIN
ncbi:MAG: hypothetical protein F4Y45_04055 [Acidobacteria bacterium]|nr:hypothetical protein [Acidobacteriota bacterium]